MHETPRFIQDHAQLKDACDIWLNLDSIGLDTEFERTRTYYSRPALVQICDGEHVSLIDPLSIDEFAPLAELLRCPRVVKVMHASEGDIEILEQLTGISPEPVFDTQTAAAFAGHGYSLGYRKLVEILLGDELDKGETRSDWMRRPLSEAQLAYAVLDVLHLLPMYRLLQSALSDLGRSDWLREEIHRTQKRRSIDRDPRRAYLRIRQARRLAPTALATLRELAAWREVEARDRDLPRQMVIKDTSLVAISAMGPRNAEDLADVPELSPGSAKRYARSLLELVEQSLASDSGPPPLSSPSIDRRHAPWLKTLKDMVKKEADALKIPAPLLAQARILEELVAAAAIGASTLPEEFEGWRKPVIGERLLSELHRMCGS